jgi:hypothetical protein
MSDIGPIHKLFRGMANVFALRPQPPLQPGASGTRQLDAFAPDPDPGGAGRGNSDSTAAVVVHAADRTAPPRTAARRHG